MTHNEEMTKSNYEQALIYFDSTTNFEQLKFDDKYQIGLTNLRTGRLDRAIDIFEKLVKSYDSDRAYYGIWSVKAHFYLGMAYETNENFDLAENQYNLFLDHWGHSRTVIIEVEMARSRLKKQGKV